MKSKKPTYEQLRKKVVKLERRCHQLGHEIETFSENHEKYTSLFERRTYCIYIHDFEGRFIDANDAALNLMGYDREDINTLCLSSLIDENQLPAAFATIKEIMQTGSQRQLSEYKVKNKNGKNLWIETEGGLIYREGKPYAIQGVARDITNRKLTVAALEESERNYRELVQNVNSIILRLDIYGNVRFINNFGLEFFGYSANEILGRNVIGSIVPATESSGRNLEALIRDLGRNPERYINNENENMLSNGKRVWIAWTNMAIEDETGQIFEILCVGNDITGRRETEKALRESETMFRVLTESAPAAILMVTGEKIIYVNSAFELISGYSKEETLAMRFWDFVHPDMQEQVKKRGMARQRGENVPYRYELKAITKEGKTRWIDLSAALITYDGNIVTLAIAYDITERTQAQSALIAREQELEKKTRDLEEMNAALRVLLHKRDEDKAELEGKIMINLKQLVEPYLDSIKQTSLTERQSNILGIIETNLSDLVSPFARNYAYLKYRLTPKEILVANLIKHGKSSKEISETLSLSIRTIEFHRTKIRNKFGLKECKGNLRALLLSLK